MSYSPSRFNVTGSSSGSESAESESGMMGQAYEKAESCVHDYPSTAMLVTFAAGMGLGFLLVAALGRREPPAPTGMRRIGRRTLDALSNVLPDSVASRLHLNS